MTATDHPDTTANRASQGLGRPTTIELDITGMTCASCAARIEKKLNRLDGVTATVNYATERATATVPPQLGASELIGVVEQSGYSARLHSPEPSAAEAG